MLNFIGDGVEYISSKTKDVYNKVTSEHEDSTDRIRADYSRSIKSDAEWLP